MLMPMAKPRKDRTTVSMGFDMSPEDYEEFKRRYPKRGERSLVLNKLIQALLKGQIVLEL